MARALNEAESSKKRLQVENQDLCRQIDELENGIANANKNKISLTTQLEDTKALGDAEAKDRAALLTKYKNMTTDLENLREKIENEHMRKSDALKALSKAQAEIQLWRSRFETEGLGRIEELEGGRAKLQARIVEAEETVDALQTKIANVEKSRLRLATDLEEIAMEYERTHAAALITEKRGKNFDKVLGEWQAKAADIAAEVEASQNEGRNYSSELFRLKAGQDEALEQLDIVKRENKNLADEIKDLLDQLGDGGRSIHDLDKQRRRLEQEKEELQAALEEAEGALEQEENKVLRAQLELSQVRQEIDRRVAEKEEEFNNTRLVLPYPLGTFYTLDCTFKYFLWGGEP
jgi:chromosome segregation ATPase